MSAGYPRVPLPELYFATVRAIGTPIGPAAVTPLSDALRASNFNLRIIRLSERLAEYPELNDVFPAADSSRYDEYMALMKCAEKLRERHGDGGPLVMEAVRYLHKTARREERKKAAEPPYRLGVAYLFRNVMHKDEVARLRKLYDRQLFVISVFYPEDKRKQHLADVLSRGTKRVQDSEALAGTLMRRELGLIDDTTGSAAPALPKDTKLRVNIEETFQHSDLFLDGSDQELAAEQVKRFVELIFRHPFHTPTIEEIGMADAFSAAMESGNLARRVGAAICAPDGELLVTGTNDVPKPGGGVYRAGDVPDYRDHSKPEWGHDSSDTHRREILQNLIEHLLADPDWMKLLDSPGSGPGQQLAQLLKQGLRPSNAVDYSAIVTRLVESPVIWQSEFFDMIEYGRTLHAEMDAITSAARKGLSIRGCTLYCTTLPCHECARLIIGAGIQRVVFIEPYEKSRAYELYKTEIEIMTLAASKADCRPKKVHFIPYVGISPRRFQELFSWVPRKKDDLKAEPNRRRDLMGDIVDWQDSQLKLGAIAKDILDGKYKGREPEIVRESIVSASSFLSAPRFADMFEHEANMYNDYIAGQ